MKSILVLEKQRNEGDCITSFVKVKEQKKKAQTRRTYLKKNREEKVVNVPTGNMSRARLDVVGLKKKRISKCEREKTRRNKKCSLLHSFFFYFFFGSYTHTYE